MTLTRRIATVFVVVVALLVGGTGAANASLSQCGAGNACIWGENSYTGCFYQKAGTGAVGRWATCSTVSSNNGANSLKANGRSCDTKFYDYANNTGPYLYFNRAVSGVNYQDPRLSNGGGVGPWRNQNWQDRISSIGWVC